MCFCLVLDYFYQFLGLAAGSYQFYVECKFLLGTSLIKTLHPFLFSCSYYSGGIIQYVHIHVCKIKGRQGET